MMALLLALLLQAPDDLASFVSALEKDRQKGAPTADLLQRLDDRLMKERAPETHVRLEWNRSHLTALVWIDSLRTEWLSKQAGKSVTVGKVTGLVKDVKADRVTLDVGGKPVEVAFYTLGPEDCLAQIRNDKVLAGPAHWEAILQFAGGKKDAALALARGYSSEPDRAACIKAFVGWALQTADRSLAEGRATRAAEFLAAGWTTDDLMQGADGTLNQFVNDTLVPKLFEQAAKVVEKDRKEGRRALDLIVKLSKSEEVHARVHAIRFPALESSQWYSVPLRGLKWHGNDRYKDDRLTWEDPNSGASTSEIDVEDFPCDWTKISGFRAKLRPEAEYLDMHVGFGHPAQYFILIVNRKEGFYFTGYRSKAGGEVKSEESKKLAAKPEYVLRFEGAKGVWKIYIDALEVKAFPAPGDPSQLGFAVDEGRCEIQSLEIRRK